MSAPETESPSWAAVITEGVTAAVRNFAVALPGTVLSYDPSSQTCSVQPGVHRLVPDADDEAEDVVEPLAPIQHVPVCWMVGRGIQVKGTLNKGDSVLLIALDRDPSGWMRSGSAQPPDDARMHHWAHAVAIPGLVPSSSPFPEPTDAPVLASLMRAELVKIKAALDTISAAVPVTHTYVAPTQAAISSTVLKLGG